MPKIFNKNISYEDLIITVGLVIRAILTFSHNYWFDEKVTLNIANFPLDKLLNMAALDNHPPLYYLYLKLFSPLLLDAYLLRFSSVLLGTLSLWVTYKFFSLVTNKKGALIGLTFMALSPLQIYYSTEIRMYPLLVLLGLCALWALMGFINSGKIKYAWTYMLFAVLAMYTHYYGVLLVAGVLAYTFLTDKIKFSKILIFSLFAILLFLPWFIYTINFPKPGCWCFPPNLGVPAIFGSFTVGLMGHFDIFDAITKDRIPIYFKAIYYLNVGYFFILYLISIIKNVKIKSIKLQIILWLPIAIMTIASIKLQLLSIRSFIIFSPLYYLAIADFLKDIKNKQILFVSIGAILLFSVAILNAVYAWDL